MSRQVVILLVILSIFCMGMGGLGGHPEGTVPKTDVRIQAEIQDRNGISTNLNQFSMDGKTFLVAFRGKGTLTIPFQHIDTITFGDVSGDELKVDAKLKSGNVLTLAVRPLSQFFGTTGFGAFEIQAQDVYSIDFR